MTITCGFFNSVNNDRKYDAIQLSSLFDGLIRDGVYSTIGDSLMVEPSSGLTVAVGSGRAWFNHTWTYNDGDFLLTLDAPDVFYPRIDAIVLEIDSDEAVRANTIKIVKGTPASIPVYPTLTNTTTKHQYPLAYISVPVGVTEILSSHITNKVGTTACPFVTGAITVVTTNELLAQWESQFMTWFDEMKDQLSLDAAGNLQLQIDAVNTEIDAIKAANRIREVFIPVSYAYDEDTQTIISPTHEGYKLQHIEGHDLIAVMNWVVPDDYVPAPVTLTAWLVAKDGDTSSTGAVSQVRNSVYAGSIEEVFNNVLRKQITTYLIVDHDEPYTIKKINLLVDNTIGNGEFVPGELVTHQFRRMCVAMDTYRGDIIVRGLNISYLAKS